MKNKYIVFLLFFVVTDALAQDLKTTEINVVEGFKVSVPQPDKLNVKATFLDTTKIDKTQEYSFINKYRPTFQPTEFFVSSNFFILF